MKLGLPGDAEGFPRSQLLYPMHPGLDGSHKVFGQVWLLGAELCHHTLMNRQALTAAKDGFRTFP